jgi:RNA polymerase sigma factor (sigma-70 family)
MMKEKRRRGNSATADENHGVELDFARECLDQNESAISNLRHQYGAALRGILTSSGASESEANDILTNLWTDCTVNHETRRPRLEGYWGQCSLMTFLKTVCMNEFVDRKRRENRWRKIEEGSGGSACVGDSLYGSQERNSPCEVVDGSLFAIMQAALLKAFDQCPAQHMVILQLVFIQGMTQRQVAGLWGCHETKISRMLDSAMERIAADTLRAVKQADPWLNLKWDDFLELCDGAGLSLFSEKS